MYLDKYLRDYFDLRGIKFKAKPNFCDSDFMHVIEDANAIIFIKSSKSKFEWIDKNTIFKKLLRFAKDRNVKHVIYDL